MARVFVAMSGGVDSSVAAALLLEEGHDVTGVTMQLWPSDDSETGCCSVSAVRDARRVCDLLGIPHYTLNYRDIFEREVVEPFAQEYATGRTPNPCIACNDRVKFADLLGKVSVQGAEFLATGHYARIERDKTGAPWLARGVDLAKDQSYFLYRLTRTQMEHVLFPVGGLRKDEVRGFAERFGLPVARKAESQDICFAGSDGYGEVLGRYAANALEPGDIVDFDGRKLGRHVGLGRYTVGQRKALCLSVPEPMYVVRLDAENNRVVVGPRSALAVTRVEASDVVWHGSASETGVSAMARYRMEPGIADAQVAEDTLTVRFGEPVEGIAPGQALVCYRGDRVIGGGTIRCAD